jgi:hypothetical protein
MKSDRTAEFLRNMEAEIETAAPPPQPPISARPAETPRRKAPERQPQAPSSRAGLKHFGGYLDDATLEKIALLRVRLKRDNSELIKLAIDELYSRHNAKRAFGDA